ncbi:hypothetical protein ACHAW6_001365 [Cyclotella cf. meneghiniana]
MKFLVSASLFLQAATSADGANIREDRYVGGLRKGVESVVQHLIGEKHHTGKHKHHHTRNKNQNNAGPKGRLSFDDDDDFFPPEAMVSKDNGNDHHHHSGDKNKDDGGPKGSLSFNDDGNDDDFPNDNRFKQEEVMVNKDDHDKHRNHHHRNRNRKNNRGSKGRLSFDDDWWKEAMES